MQDEQIHENEDDLENQMENDNEEEEDISHISNPNTVILRAIQNMKDELAIHNITKRDINSKIKELSIIPLDKLWNLLLKFVKRTNLSIHSRKILFAAITPIHHIYMRLLTSYRSKDPSLIISNYSNTVSSSSPPPFDAYSLKKSVEYFIKVYEILELGNQIIDENSFAGQIKTIIQKMEDDNKNENNSVLTDNIQQIEENLEILNQIFDDLHYPPKNGFIPSEKLDNCKIELKKFKISVLPYFSLDESTVENEYQAQFLKSYDVFYEQFRNFKLFHKINLIISKFKANWNEPLAWFLPCQMTSVKSDTIFDTAMDYLKTFWLICDMNIFNESRKENSQETHTEQIAVEQPQDNHTVEANEEEQSNEMKPNNENEKISEEDKNHLFADYTNNPEIDETVERTRREIFDILDLFSFTNKLQPQKSSFYAQGYQVIVAQYNSYFASHASLLKGSYDTDCIKVITGIISGLHFNLDEVTLSLNQFLGERIKLLTQNSPIILSDGQNEGKKEMPSYIFPNGQQISPARINHDLCNAMFNELFAYVHSFIVFASKARNTAAFSLIQNEIEKLINFYSELFLKVQMTEDSDALVYEALFKAKEAEKHYPEANEKIETLDGIITGFTSLIECTERLLNTNFVKEDKRDFLERFLIYLKIHLPFYRFKKKDSSDLDQIKESLSSCFYLFDPLDLFCVEKLDVHLPEFAAMSIDLDNSSEHLNPDIDSNIAFTQENMESLFNQSFHVIRAKALKYHLDSNEDWKTVLEFKCLYETFCGLYIVKNPQLPFNEEPSEFERDLQRFFKLSDQIICDFDLNLSETQYPVKDVLSYAHELAILLIFSKESHNEIDFIHQYNNAWNYTQLALQIPLLKIPHSIQTIWMFISMLMNKKKHFESNSQQIKSFIDIFNNFLVNFDSESINQLCLDENITETISKFENDQDFYFYSVGLLNGNNNDDDSDSDSQLVHYDIKKVLHEFQAIKDQYLELSQIVTEINSKYFDKTQSYASFYVEIIFFANLLKSFRDTLFLLKKYDLLTAPIAESETLKTYHATFDDKWPITLDLLNLDLYEKDLPDFLTNLYKSILNLLVLTPDFKHIRSVFNFYMNLALSTYSFCFSSINSLANQKSNRNPQSEIMEFKWNRDNFTETEVDPKSEVPSTHNSEICLNLIRKHFDKLALIYSTTRSQNPSSSQCCEILRRSTILIKLLNQESLSGFKALADILTSLCECCFSIFFALNIKHQVQQIINATVKFLSLFGLTVSDDIRSHPENGEIEVKENEPDDANSEKEDDEQDQKPVRANPAPSRSLTAMRRNSSTKPNIQKESLHLSDFPKLQQAFEHASPIFERTAELMPQDIPETSTFLHAKSLYQSLYSYMQELDVPATSERFVSLLAHRNKKMEQLAVLATSELHRIEGKIERTQNYFTKMKNSLESDYNCISQKIEDETTRGEQLDEALSTIKTNPTKKLHHKNQNQKTKCHTTINQNSVMSEDDENTLNFNFNTKVGKLNGKTQLLMAQTQEIKKQNDKIRSQLQKNQLELSILDCIDNESNEDAEPVDQIIDRIHKNSMETSSPDGHNILSYESILSIVSAIKTGTEQTSEVTNVSHSDLCDKAEMLAYNLISSTHREEAEMIQMQSKLKSLKNSQHDKLLKLRNVLKNFHE